MLWLVVACAKVSGDSGSLPGLAGRRNALRAIRINMYGADADGQAGVPGRLRQEADDVQSRRGVALLAEWSTCRRAADWRRASGGAGVVGGVLLAEYM